jgi:uncharacterized membrane protein YgcG
MGTAGRSAPLRRAGSLLGLLGLELGAILALHWLGRFPGLRIGWDSPVPWVLSSPVQDVLGAVLRTVGLVMAYWLLASTVLYLLASLTRLPSAVRAVRWATLPLARRVADHAVAVTLATSMVGGSTLGMAGPALAADSRGPGPPARAPVAASQQPTDTTAYGFDEAGPDAPDQATSSTEETTTTTEAVTTTTEAASTTTEAASTTTSASSTSTTAPPATATSASSTTTTTSEPSTTATTQAPTTQPPTTATGRPATTTTTPGAARGAPPAYEFEDAGRGTAPPATTAGPASTAAPTTSTAGLRPPAYPFITPGEDREAREASGDAGSGGGGGDQGDGSSGGGASGGGGGSGGGGSGGGAGGEEREGTDQQKPYVVQRGDNLWTIARNHLRGARSGGSGEPSNREVAEYWAKVVEANRHGLESGDPDLIYPDEKISLPPTD